MANKSPGFVDGKTYAADFWNSSFVEKIDANGGDATSLTVNGSPVASTADVTTAVAGKLSTMNGDATGLTVGGVPVATATDIAAGTTALSSISTTVFTTRDIVVTNQQELNTLSATTTTNKSATDAAMALLQTNLQTALNRITALETASSVPAVPNAPTALAATTTTLTTQVLTFTAPASGPAVTLYQSQAALAGTGAWVDKATSATSPITVTALTQDTLYDYRVIATNAAGPGGISGTVTKRTTAPVVTFTPSAAWSNIPAQSSLVMDDGGLVTLESGVVQLTPFATGIKAPMGSSSFVDLVVKADTGRIFQHSVAPGLPPEGGWWYWDPTTTNLWVFTTDPRPVIPGTSTPRQRLLTYLQSISGNHVLSGQTTQVNNAEYDADTAALGFPVALVSYNPWHNQWANNYLYEPGFVSLAIAHWNAGGIVRVDLGIPNPNRDGSGSSDGPAVIATQVLTVGSTQYNGLIFLLNQVATDVLIPLKNAGVPVMLRYMWELDGNWFWWGISGHGGFGAFTNAQQTQLYRLIHDYFISRGLDNLLFTFAVNGGPWTYQYPGDDLVDIVGVDAYTNNPPDYTNIYNQLRAQAPTKLIALTEWGSGTSTANNLAFNTQTLINWLKTTATRVCYVDAWSGWGWNQETNAIGGLTDPWVINRAGVHVPPPGVVTPGTRLSNMIPFSSASVWNIGIGNSATWGAAGDADVITLRSLTGVINSGAWSQPIYFGGPGDPLVTVTCTDPLFPVPVQQIRIPTTATPAAGGDHHMNFYDSTQPGKMWSYFGCTLNNGVNVTGGITAALGGVWSAVGDGITSGIASNQQYDYLVGTITTADLTAGVIQHTLRYSMSVDSTHAPGATWTDNMWYPNTHSDFDVSQYVGNIDWGVTVGLPSSVNINALGLSTGGLMIAKALQDYGAIMRDSGGTHAINFYVAQQAAGNALVSQMGSALSTLVPLLSIMRNQNIATPMGGGTPRVPALPPVVAA